MGNQIKIRELRKGDIPLVEKIYDLYWSGSFRENLSKKLNGYFENSPEIIAQGFKYFVAERDGEVVGVSAFRKAPEHMKAYAKTDNPVEFYILAVKDQRQGIGKTLRNREIEEVKKLGYTEAIFFSAESHKDSWAFHDKSEFKRVGDAIAPNGEPGKIWRMEF